MSFKYVFNLRWHSTADVTSDLPTQSLDSDEDEVFPYWGVSIDLPERVVQDPKIAEVNLSVESTGYFSTPFRTGVKAALVVAWNDKVAEVLCPYRCAGGRHEHPFRLPTGGIWHETLAACPKDNSKCRYRLIFPFEDHPVTKSFGWILDGSPLQFVTVPWDMRSLSELSDDNNARRRTRTANVDDVSAAMESLSLRSTTLKQLQSEVAEMRRKYPSLSSKLDDLHVDSTVFDEGENQGAIVHKMLLTALLHQKPIGCLYRGKTLPCEFVASGYGRNETDHWIIKRQIWVKAVMYSSERAGYELKTHTCDSKELHSDGSFLACHVEKQSLARFLWSHSTFFVNAKDVEALGRCSPPDLGGLPIDIYVCQPFKPDWDHWVVCPDCCSYLDKEAKRWKLTLRLLVVKGKEIHLFRFWRHGILQDE